MFSLTYHSVFDLCVHEESSVSVVDQPGLPGPEHLAQAVVVVAAAAAAVDDAAAAVVVRHQAVGRPSKKKEKKTLCQFGL